MMIENERPAIALNFNPPATTHQHYTRLYQAALIQYAVDVSMVIRGKCKTVPDASEAFQDFYGSRKILAYLCEQAGLNLEWVERKLARFLMNPPKRLSGNK